MSAIVLEHDPVSSALIDEARTWSTARLVAHRDEGLYLAATGGSTVFWPETLRAIDTVLFERAAAEAEVTA